MSDSATPPDVPLDADLLRAFVAVAECRGFTRAARFLHRTQSAVSLQVKRLEEALECTLFDRSGRQVELTPQGEVLLGHARRLIQLHGEAVASVREAGGRRPVRVGMPDEYATRYLPPLLAELAERFPEARPEVHCDVSTALVEALDRGELDLALVVRHPPAAPGETIGCEELAFACAPDFAADPGAPVPLALYPEGCVYRRSALRALYDAGRESRVVFCSQSPTGINIAVEAGRAVAVKARRTVPGGWRLLGPEEGFPALEPAEVELRAAPTASWPAARAAAGRLRDLARTDLSRRSAGS